MSISDEAHRAFLPDLDRVKAALREVEKMSFSPPPEVRSFQVNPALQLLQVGWKGLAALAIRGEDTLVPEEGKEFVLVWRHPVSGEVIVDTATDEDLLALKMVVEGLSPDDIAGSGGVPAAAVEETLYRAARRGIVLRPEPRIRRDPTVFRETSVAGEEYLSTETFTLQWHITQACDLHCRHCYDRSDRSPLSLERAVEILDEFREFCRDRRVRGHISFSGGNPLLYPGFKELYRRAADKGFSVAILGNAATRSQVEEIVDIAMPTHYQVSLEGLEKHNDAIRGRGYFRRVMEFLPVLRDLGVYSMVMLTLTRDNVDQVIPLAEYLRDRVDSFTFNRLSPVGEGAALQLPDRDDFVRFLEGYLDAAQDNPVMGLKDNLFNIILYRRGGKLTGGCTGYGCGAAFNFLTLLPEGEVHACRKFPSLIGNINERSLAELYDSESAARYRAGASACLGCSIRPVCGGCLAVAHGMGVDVFEGKDPFCFAEGKCA